MQAHVYILRCADNTFYIGTTMGSLTDRIAAHNDGSVDGYTVHRRPVEVVFHRQCENIAGALAAKRFITGWDQAKRDRLIAGDTRTLRELTRRLA